MGSSQGSRKLDPRSSEWETVPGEANRRVYRNRSTGDKIQGYRFIVNDITEFSKERETYEIRLNSPTLVASKFLIQDTQGDICSTYYKGEVFMEYISYRLSQIDEIPYPDVLHLYQQCFRGFGELYHLVGYFDITEDLVCVNGWGQAKVWLNPSLEKVRPEISYASGSSTEGEMVNRLLKIIDRNTNQSTVPGNLGRVLSNANPQSFKEAEGVLLNIVMKQKMTIPTNLRSAYQLIIREGLLTPTSTPIQPLAVIDNSEPVYSELQGSPQRPYLHSDRTIQFSHNSLTYDQNNSKAPPKTKDPLRVRNDQNPPSNTHIQLKLNSYSPPPPPHHARPQQQQQTPPSSQITNLKFHTTKGRPSHHGPDIHHSYAVPVQSYSQPLSSTKVQNTQAPMTANININPNIHTFPQTSPPFQFKYPLNVRRREITEPAEGIGKRQLGIAGEMDQIVRRVSQNSNSLPKTNPLPTPGTSSAQNKMGMNKTMVQSPGETQKPFQFLKGKEETRRSMQSHKQNQEAIGNKSSKNTEFFREKTLHHSQAQNPMPLLRESSKTKENKLFLFRDSGSHNVPTHTLSLERSEPPARLATNAPIRLAFSDKDPRSLRENTLPSQKPDIKTIQFAKQHRGKPLTTVNLKGLQTQTRNSHQPSLIRKEKVGEEAWTSTRGRSKGDGLSPPHKATTNGNKYILTPSVN